MSADDGETGCAPRINSQDNSRLWELALRLVPPHYGPNGPSSEPPQLWPGQIPDLPFELPTPVSAHLVGSYGRGPHLTVLLDSDASPKELVGFYEQRMLRSGWSTPSWWQDRRGGFFPPQESQHAQALFCGGAEGPSLIVAADRDSNGPTHGALTINLDAADTPCRPPVDRDYGPAPTPIGPAIPPLEAPPDCELVSFGTSLHGTTSIAVASITTDLGLGEIAAHYGRQLEETGWRLAGEGAHGPIAWSAWTFADRSPASGLLAVIRNPGAPRTHDLLLRARREAGEG